MFIKPFRCLVIVFASMLAFSSCIREEALNAECDITGLDSTWLEYVQLFDIMVGQPIVKNDQVTITFKNGIDRTTLNPSFSLTPGATISPANGTVRDFTTPQTYITTSQDGKWHKTYKVTFDYSADINDTLAYRPLSLLSFEHSGLNAKSQYYEFYEVDSTDANNSRRNYWDSGNAGFLMSGMAKTPDDFPTVSSADGFKGKCAKLVTLSTGSFGKGVNMPIAAGNLFVGDFTASQAMVFPLKATKFGKQLVTAKPVYLAGFYKYTAGATFTNAKMEVLPARHDTCDIYAVVYKVNPANVVPLNGANVLSSDSIVMMARIQNPGEPKDWKYFVEPFHLVNGQTFDPAKIKDFSYAITLVFTSSRQGAFFEGAIGSTLSVDEIRVVWDTDKDVDKFKQ